MLRSLLIKDFILIDSLQVTFENGYTSITGETGAGKSIFVGALSMLMGKRSDAELIRHGANRAIIEGEFIDIPTKALQFLKSMELDCPDSPNSCIIRREIGIGGRNRSFVNDVPTPLNTISKLAEYILDIHSQHRNLLLGDAGFILNAIDRMGKTSETRHAYEQLFEEYTNAVKDYKRLQEKLAKASEEYDYDSFRYNELEQANLTIDEEIKLEEAEKILRYADEIKTSLFQANELLTGGAENTQQLLQQVAHELTPLVEKIPEIASYIERIESCRIEITDIAHDLITKSDAIEANPQELQVIEERIDLLNRLFSKYRLATSKELIELRDNLKESLDLYTDGNQRLEESSAHCNTLKKKLDEVAMTLSQQRKKASDLLADKLQEMLSLLEMPHSKVCFKFKESNTPLATGYDIVDFLFTANNKLPLKPVGEIASGGEMARLMLSLKAQLAKKENLPTILFDEIDTGISGRVADRMGSILRQMGETMQVIAITHLPQIAAQSDFQKHIEKVLDTHGEPITSIRSLSPTERVNEIASLLSADVITPESLEAAKILLQKS